MLVEGYLQVVTPLWAWEDEVAERMVNVQEYWLARSAFVATRNDEPHYGVICTDWHKLARFVYYARSLEWMSHATSR